MMESNFEVDFDQDAQIYAKYENTFYYLKDFGTDHMEWVQNSDETEFLHFSQINTNGTNSIEFTCAPDSYTIAINGITLGSFPAPFSYSTNNIALFSYTYYDGENKVAFDNFSAQESSHKPPPPPTKIRAQTIPHKTLLPPHYGVPTPPLPITMATSKKTIKKTIKFNI